MEESGIHDENPFVTPPEEREPARRLRGRLVAPVTIVTAGSAEGRAGLTVSSLMAAEGEPSHVFFLVGTDTEFYDAMELTGRFVVHVLGAEDRDIADVFAGLRPNPGGPFAGLDIVDGDYGPELTQFGTKAYCTFEGGTEEAYHLLARGAIERIDLDDLTDPLSYFRGAYRRLE